MLKPQRVVLVSSAETETLGITERLRSLLTAEGLSVCLKSGLPSRNLSRIMEFARMLLDELGRSCAGEAMVLHLTGGNKLMAIARRPSTGTGGSQDHLHGHGARIVGGASATR
jgi:hypothetical protein